MASTAPAEELGFYGVYRVTSDPQAPELFVSDLRRPNGIVFSPDQTRLYVADTGDARVLVFDVNESGSLDNQRTFVQYADLTPDGLEVDREGNLYIAGPEGAIWIYSPAGDLLGKIDTPERRAISPGATPMETRSTSRRGRAYTVCGRFPAPRCIRK
jgi:gluconolactonase